MIHDNLYKSVLSQNKLNSICSTLESTQTPYLTTFNTMNKVEEYLHLYEICTKSLITYQLIMYFTIYRELRSCVPSVTWLPLLMIYAESTCKLDSADVVTKATTPSANSSLTFKDRPSLLANSETLPIRSPPVHSKLVLVVSLSNVLDKSKQSNNLGNCCV